MTNGDDSPLCLILIESLCCISCSRFALSTMDLSAEGTPDDVADAVLLRRQIIKLNRRLQMLEEESRERAKRHMVMCSLSMAFWLVSSWAWFRR
uniref:Mitochondrial fission factor n=1 Tax=Scleropages formosus TaxID=113540 RepID=A0A8C9R8Z5_SCLFO